MMKKKKLLCLRRNFKRICIRLGDLSSIAHLLWTSMSSMEKIATELGEVLLDCIKSGCPFCHPNKKDVMQNVTDYYERFKMFALAQRDFTI